MMWGGVVWFFGRGPARWRKRRRNNIRAFHLVPHRSSSSGPTPLNFTERTGCSAIDVVWPFPNPNTLAPMDKLYS